MNGERIAPAGNDAGSRRLGESGRARAGRAGARARPRTDLVELLNESFAQWGLADARAAPEGGGAVVRHGPRTLRVERPGGGTSRPAAWTLDGVPLPSVLEVLREVREALEPDFVPLRLRIGRRPPGSGARPAPRPLAAAADRGTESPRGGRLPVHVLTGFLGSGKTTVLNRLLRDERLRDTAVVVNELGTIGIDHLLVESSDDAVVELAGGCLCCAVRGDLALTLADLVARRDAGACPPFSRILVETSGLADPTPIEGLLLSDPGLAERLEMAGISTCVDASSGDSALRRYPEAMRQAALADLVILTKTDLSPPPPALDERLGRLNPHADRATAIFGRILAGRDGSPVDALPRRHRPRPHVANGPVPGNGAESVRHTNGIDTFPLVRHEPLPGAALTLFLRGLVEHAGDRLLRFKGFVEIEEARGRPVTVNGVGHVFEPVEPRRGWPDADRRSRLVLIGQGLSAAWCGRLLDAVVAEVEGARGGSRAI